MNDVAESSDRSVRERVAARAARSVDIASLATFRIIFGVVMFAGIVRMLGSGWIPQVYGEPRFFFTYPGFSWVAPWPVWGMYVHYVVLAILALAIAAGAWLRFSAALFTLGFAYAQLVDVTNYLNHHYLVVLLGGLLAFLPASAAWSIDARRANARGKADAIVPREAVPAWMIWLVRFQVGIVYVFAGLAKAKEDWLLYGQPLNLWLSARIETPIIGQCFDEPNVALAMSWAGFLFDTTIVLWLSWRRTRLPAYFVLIGFHGLTGYLFRIGMFPLIMTSAALIFFSPSWPRRLLRRLGVRAGRLVDEPEATRNSTSTETCRLPSRPALAAIAFYALVQIALPLRHHVYPGMVLWNEDGMRFAWHVMIREKHGAVNFIAELEGGRRIEVPPSTYLTWRQEREMAGQPDLILQLARQIGRDLRARGHHDVQVFVETAVSLNGRRPRAMISPHVDLLGVRDLGSRSWVTPDPPEPPAIVHPLR
jgi:vitamin K-dependent gamma-carboxylase